MVDTMVLSPGQAERLQAVILGQPLDVPQCRYRGCIDPGHWYLQRTVKGEGVQFGLYCTTHDEKFGAQNLRRWARTVGRRVVILKDVEGEFEGIEI